jgi:cytoskeletal protein RodZ
MIEKLNQEKAEIKKELEKLNQRLGEINKSIKELNVEDEESEEVEEKKEEKNNNSFIHVFMSIMSFVGIIAGIFYVVYFKYHNSSPTQDKIEHIIKKGG